MKKFVALAALAGVVTPGLASAELYAKGDFGFGFNQEVDVEEDGGEASSPVEDDFNFGLAIGGTGFFFPNTRFEGEVRYAKGNDELFGALETETIQGFANAFYDVPVSGPFQPFVGGGIGYSDFEIEAPGPDGTTSDSDGGFSWQLIGGVAVPLGAGWTAEGAYRWQQALDIELEDVLGSGTEADVDGSFFTFGLRKTLGVN